MGGGRERSRQSEHRLGRALIALMVWLLTLLTLFVLGHDGTSALLGALQGKRSALTEADLPAMVATIGIPLAAAALAYVLASGALRAIRVITYSRALHAFTGQHLKRHAPVYQAGTQPRLLRYGHDGLPASDDSETLTRLAASYRGLLVLGSMGAGKSVALEALAYEYTRRRMWLSLIFGRRALPVLVPLAGYAQAPLAGVARQPRINFIAHQLARFGTAGLARQARHLLAHDRLLLLCDDLSAVPEMARGDVCSELAEVASGRHAHGGVIVTCLLSAYTEAPQSFSGMRRLERTLLGEITPGEATALLNNVVAGSATTLASHTLDAAISSPAQLAAIIRVLHAGQPLPSGRGQLLEHAITLLCRAGDARQAPEAPTPLQTLLGMLAGALKQATISELPLSGMASAGTEVAEWIMSHEPVSANDHRTSSVRSFARADAEALCRSAIQSGILVIRSDGQAISFSHSLIEDAFAAWWLKYDDDGLGRLHADLLRPQWALPVILWSTASKDPADVAKRLLRLADTPESTGIRAGLAARGNVYPMALALALAAALESFAIALAQPPAPQPPRIRPLDLAQQHLRDLLDQTHIYTTMPDHLARLSRALQHIEEASGPELAASITFLARHSPLNRLVRAQLLSIFGMLASPPAMSALVSLLGEVDPVMRQATDQAFQLAGVSALGPLQNALTSMNESIRIRASQILAGLGDIAIENAIQGLSSEHSGERAASARALGLLKASLALDALIARLDDAESEVKVAAAGALGQIGGVEAQTALIGHVHAADANLRASVATALGTIRSRGAVATLVVLLADPEGDVRGAAASALGLVGDARAIEPLRARRDDPDPWAQHAVVAALRRLGTA